MYKRQLKKSPKKNQKSQKKNLPKKSRKNLKSLKNPLKKNPQKKNPQKKNPQKNKVKILETANLAKVILVVNHQKNRKNKHQLKNQGQMNKHPMTAPKKSLLAQINQKTVPL